MTMKSLLLGAAAGLLTVGAAQAADLPMTKAEPVEYVKVCSEFGEGFFYIPGTDTCLKISGEIRANYRFFDRQSRQTDVTQFSTEPRLKFDARTATEYGTLRSYIQINMPVQDGSGSSLWNHHWQGPSAACVWHRANPNSCRAPMSFSTKERLPSG